MCCDNSGCAHANIVAECPDCGGSVDEDGWTYDHCNYSSVECQTCGWAPCDGAC